ncbi:MAG TPA: hypothetical protein VNK82_09000 [Terriglobales bacterium]|nr:hypothetical protein [Terriglobales bacterium]
MPILPLIFVVFVGAGAFLLLKSAGGSGGLATLGRVVGALVISLPLGLLTYGALGIGIARYRQVGRFYSVPFGGYAVSDAAFAWSLVTWMAPWLAAVVLVTRRRLRRGRDGER